MNCKEIKKLLNPYIDKTIDADIARQVDEHLKSCPLCNKEYQSLKEVITSLNSLSTQPVPVDFTQSIMTKISQEEIQIQSSWIDHLKRQISIPSLSFPRNLSFPRKWASIFSFRLAGAVAAVALIVFFAFTFIFNTPDTYPIC